MENYVVLTAFYHKYEADLCIGLLKENNIDAQLKSEDLAGFGSTLTLGNGNYQVLVDSENVENAKKILNKNKEIGDSKSTIAQKGRSTRKTSILLLFLVIFAIVIYQLNGYSFFGNPPLYVNHDVSENFDAFSEICQKELGVAGEVHDCKDVYSNGQTKWHSKTHNKKTEGLAREFHYDGKLRWEGFYRKGLQEGEFKEYDFDGNIKIKGKFRAGLLSGIYIEYYPNAEKRSVMNYEDGVLNGKYISFYDDGTVLEEVDFVKGKRLDQEGNYYSGEDRILLKNGQLFEFYNYKDGLLHGLSEIYSDKGSKEFSAVYANGKLHGAVNYFYPDGQLFSEEHYFDDVMTSVKEYDRDGNLIYEREYF